MFRFQKLSLCKPSPISVSKDIYGTLPGHVKPAAQIAERYVAVEDWFVSRSPPFGDGYRPSLSTIVRRQPKEKPTTELDGSVVSAYVL